MSLSESEAVDPAVGVAPAGPGVAPVMPVPEAWMVLRRRLRMLVSSLRLSRASGDSVCGRAIASWG